MKRVSEDKPFEFMSNPMAVTATPSGSYDEPPREFDIYQIVFKYKWVLVIAMLTGLALGNLAFIKLGPEFNAVASILVSQQAQVPNRDLPSVWEQRTEHVAIIKSPMIVGKAIEKGSLEKLVTLQKSADPVDDIISALEVRRTAGQDTSFLNVFELKYRSKVATDARATVNAIILAYHDYLKASQEEVTGKLVKHVEGMNTDLAQVIDRRQHELVEFRKNAPLMWKNAPGAGRQPGDVTNVHQERLLEIERDRRANLLKRAEINGKIKSLNNAKANGKSPEDMESLARMLIASTQPGTSQATTGAVSGSPVLIPGTSTPEQASTQLLPLLLEEQKLLRDFGDDHPDVSNIRKSISRVREFYEARGIALPEFDPLAAKGKKLDFVAAYTAFLDQQLEEIGYKDKELDAVYERESQKVKDVVKYMVEDQGRGEELDRLKAQWNALANNLSQLDMNKDNKGYTMKLLSPVQELWSMKRYLKVVGAVLIGVMGLTAGLIFLRELRDTTVKTTDDIRRLMPGISVIGTVPWFTANAADYSPELGILPALCYFHRPGSGEAEAYRTIRTALAVGLDGIKQKVIQVSSPEPGDGKSTLAGNLALALAQSGKRVVLIDADLRRPMIHRLFGARKELGTADILARKTSFAEALQPSKVANLWLVTAGETPPNPAESLASEDFDKLLAIARADFDYVLVDTPPFLAVSDPCIVAPRTDGLLLVVRAEKNTRAVVRHTNHMIVQHGIKMLGIVTNGLKPQPGTHYGYGYTYGYKDYLDATGAKMERAVTPVAVSS